MVEEKLKEERGIRAGDKVVVRDESDAKDREAVVDHIRVFCWGPGEAKGSPRRELMWIFTDGTSASHYASIRKVLR